MVKWIHVQGVLLVMVVATIVLLTARSWTVPEHQPVMAAIESLGGEWVGRHAPDFALRDVDGVERRLTDFRGNVVFLNFWASFCEPCRDEMPSMESLVRQYSHQGLVMVAISHDETMDEVTGFMGTFLPGERSAMTILWDPTVSVAPQYGTELIPETYIIDREGRIVARFVSAYDWTRPEVKQLIEGLIQGRPTRLW